MATFKTIKVPRRRRWRIDWFWVAVVTFVLGVVVVFVGGVIGELRKTSAENACLELGWSSARVPWSGWGTAYCVKRVDQTDEVRPLEDLR